MTLADLPTLPVFITENLAVPRAIALGERRGDTTVTLSAAEVYQRAAAVAQALRGHGVGAGDRVAIVAENSVAWVIADFGILLAGAVVVPMFATTAADQIAFILQDSAAKLVFAGDEASAAVVRGAAGPATPPIVVFGDQFASFVAQGAALHAADPAAVGRFGAERGLDDLAVLIYTSGTTGTPKGVMLSHRNLAFTALAAFQPHETEMQPGDVALSVLPLAHIYEHTNMLGFLFSRAQHFITTPERLLPDMRALRPMHVAFVPRIFERMLAGIVTTAIAGGGMRAKLVPWAIAVGMAYERALRDGPPPSLWLRMQHQLAFKLMLSKVRGALGLDRLKYFVSGSAPLHKDTGLVFAAMGIPVLEGYGLTETSPIVTVNRIHDNVLGSVGLPLDGVEMRIAEDGEILVKGPNVMLGYYHVAPDEQPFTSDGYFQTGDIGRLDAGGHLFITDRKREIFKSSGGKWVSPARIESAIKRSVLIGQVIVFGDNRPHPSALVAPNWDAVRIELGIDASVPTGEMSQRDDVRHVMIREVEQQTADLAKYEQVHRIGIFPRDLTIEDGELSPTLKIKRRVVEARYIDLIEAAYAENLKAREPANA
jgi:long-chain acyl-CoA synthetase